MKCFKSLKKFIFIKLDLHLYDFYEKRWKISLLEKINGNFAIITLIRIRIINKTTRRCKWKFNLLLKNIYQRED